MAGQTIKDTNAAVVQYAGKKEGLTGCAISFKESSRKLSMVLDGPITGVKNTGLFDMLAALIADGYTATIEDTVITDGASFKACPVWNSLKKLDKGGEEQFTVAVNKTGGTAVLYTVAVSYPDPDAPATQAAEDNEPANTRTVNWRPRRPPSPALWRPPVGMCFAPQALTPPSTRRSPRTWKRRRNSSATRSWIASRPHRP